MLVEELIAKLQEFDPKLQVITSGYEGGVDDIECVSATKIALNVNTEWYYGKHENVDSLGYRDLSQYKQVDAVYVG
jgi:inhibitor of KinA sporulation pathway (predicted exonuclease)